MKITEIARYNKTSAAGKPYVSVALKCEEYADRRISGFGNKDNESWVVGDVVDIVIEPKGEYLNFTMPKGSFQKGGTTGDINRVETKIDALRADVATLGATMTGMRGVLGEILQKIAPAEVDPF